MGDYKPYPAYKDSGIAWLGEIPAHWDLRRLKFVCWRSAVYGANVSAARYQQDGVRFLRTTDIDDYGNLLNENPVYLEPEAVKEYLLDDGDLLLSRSGTIGRSFLYSHKFGKCAYAGYLVRFSLKKEYSPQFIFYFTKSSSFTDWLGTAVIQSTIGNVNGQKYSNMPLPVPPLPEQRAIAAFLDRETAHLDTLIAKKRELIDLLRRQRTALISHAVTKGLDPSAPLKDSGIAWLGQIPAHWDVLPIKFRFDVQLGKMLQSTPNSPLDTIEPYIRAANIEWGHVNLSDIKEMWFSPYEKQKYGLRYGDLLVSEGGDVGRSAIWYGEIENCYIQNAINRVRSRGANSTFYLYYWLYFLKHVGFIDILCNRATIAHYTAVKVANTPVVLPPPNEEEKIVDYLDRETARIDRLIEKIEESIALLQRQRTALISAAVTGKISVERRCIATSQQRLNNRENNHDPLQK